MAHALIVAVLALAVVKNFPAVAGRELRQTNDAGATAAISGSPDFFAAINAGATRLELAGEVTFPCHKLIHLPDLVPSM